MIICTGCGTKNDDEARFCEECGRKLQSSRRTAPTGASPGAPLSRFRHQGIAPGTRTSLWRMAEAWAYVLMLAVVGAVCVVREVWWPLYPAVALLGLIAWLRRI
ncbi:zinc-ribbon domain-containing protein [Pseudodesulfovibrio sp. F-1]|uniref:Zinc-ribbon domain-containing protein n=1 Tax=Pseudodesulfovibrio alkaliphilus TaxID=2661613 RepID=A0A7K1KJ53_9BACT|nr:zinc-ribbon domain-containing protein [Pseudodesulfovibrio alkaliphilus]